MDTTTMVADALIDGQKLINELLEKGFELTAAFWVKTTEEDRWQYYVVSPLVDTEGVGKAYLEFCQVVMWIPQPFRVSIHRVKLLGPSDPTARDVVAVLQRLLVPPTGPFQYSGSTLGDLWNVEEVYLYPLPVAASPKT